MYTGLVSITFRKLSPQEIIALVAKAGLNGIEWGGDMHVPHGNIERAREVYKMTADAGLKVAAYGSYYHVGCEDQEGISFRKVLDTALELKAPTIRVWAGNRGSQEADGDWWAKVANETCRISEMAEGSGITISFEYHPNTLTDTAESTLRLIKTVKRDNIASYWQPTFGLDFKRQIEGLKQVLPWIGNTHVFWWDRNEIQPLVDGMDTWKKYIEVIGTAKGDRFCMVEFVRNLCAQHNNGGLGIDKWWQTNTEGFFAAGEVSASHGVYRPGGSALNAGQVGSSRVAQFIAQNRQGEPIDIEKFKAVVSDKVAKVIDMCDSVTSNENNISEIWDNAVKKMSKVGAAIRDYNGIKSAIEELNNELENFSDIVKINDSRDLEKVYRLYDILICQYVYLSAMADYVENGGKSRGSALYSDRNGNCQYESLPEIFSFTLDDGKRSDLVQEVEFADGRCSFNWRKVRQIPKEDYFFENIWRNYRENKNIY